MHTSSYDGVPVPVKYPSKFEVNSYAQPSSARSTGIFAYASCPTAFRKSHPQCLLSLPIAVPRAALTNYVYDEASTFSVAVVMVATVADAGLLCGRSSAYPLSGRCSTSNILVGMSESSRFRWMVATTCTVTVLRGTGLRHITGIYFHE